mmetsp:Transcript_29838/g.76539  ORF Transcript_29838/g.76539 Transcript_29838/m.76539 type:complete len:82 (-) Transcript_29838:29-274(-)
MGHGGCAPQYEETAETPTGPFTSTVHFKAPEPMSATGESRGKKKDAQQSAAMRALEQLGARSRSGSGLSTDLPQGASWAAC